MPGTTTVRITPPDVAPGRPVPPFQCGHFLEQSFFHNVDGGVFDEGSPFAVDGPGPLAGCRADVIEACRELGVPLVRWPGGNVASGYHWLDGTGPRAARPRRLELAWGAEEDNRFGTPEFLAWCAAIGAEPYLAHSCSDVEEAARWVEYTNYGGDTALTRLRAADGRDQPWDVRIWGLGNEVYGDWQLGHRPVDRYVADAREHARFMRAVDPGLSFVGVGQDDPDWTAVVVDGLGGVIDFLALHLYGASGHLVDRSLAEYTAIVTQPRYLETEIAACAEVIDEVCRRRGIQRVPTIALDEWNIRHREPAGWPEPEPGAGGGVAARDVDPSLPLLPGRVNRYSPRTLADALFYAGVFHALRRTVFDPVPVAMANTVNLVNANPLLEVRPDGLVRSASFWVWELYGRRLGPVALPVEVTGPGREVDVRLGDTPDQAGFRTRRERLPWLDVVAGASSDRRTGTLAVINTAPDEAARVAVSLVGDGAPDRPVERVTTVALGAGGDDLFAVNTLADPDRVRTSAPVEVVAADGVHTVPAHAVTLFTFPL